MLRLLMTLGLLGYVGFGIYKARKKEEALADPLGLDIEKEE